MQKMLMSSVAESTKVKVDLLNSQAWELRVKNSNQARQYSQEALALAESIHYDKGKAEGLRTLGFCYLRLSEHEKALEHLEEALQLFQVLDDEKGLSDVYEYKGIIRRSQGDYAASLDFLFQSAGLREKLLYEEGKSLSYYHLGITYRYLGNYSTALDYLLQSLSIARKNNFWVGESYCLNNIGLIYFENNDFANALEYYQQSLEIRKANGDEWGEARCLDNIGITFFKLKKYAEAIEYCQKSLEITKATGDKKGQGNSLYHLGDIHFHLRNYEKACAYWMDSQKIRMQVQDKKGQAEILFCLSQLYSDKGYTGYSTEKALHYLEKGARLGNKIKAKDTLSRIHEGYYRLLKTVGQYQEALHHYEKHMAYEKEVHSEAMNKKVINLEISHKIEQSKKETELYRLRNTELANLNQQIIAQKKETELQRDNLKKALAELKATQSQLIQSEKMASLGELTAGVAHEIQNPLNFVNNFSEVSVELCAELKQELEAGRLDTAQSLINDLAQNMHKIQHHGRRADSIVKGMLQHSRSSTVQKEQTDMNALTEEYMRLSYHGLRAKNKTFNVRLIKNLDLTLEKIEVVPQEIGRVLLNLFNNAFYAVQQRQQQGEPDYEPEVQVSTRQLDGVIEVRVRDNGTGITGKVKEKIFQPFFTTKPCGQGTGLGLSLSYEIITKGHGGKLQVESQVGKFTEFIIELPHNKIS
ncbi:hypothetical protein GCM10027443_35520 [Pontibacter brevis]